MHLEGNAMKKITLATLLLALCFATGFTCSKNAPQQVATPPEATVPTDAQNQMAAPPESATAPVMDSTQAPAQPAAVTK